MKYGTYTTIDCPTNNFQEAYTFLSEEFSKINGRVRKVMNDHDFGGYPSFEIDYPEELEDIIEDENYDDDENNLSIKKDKWIEQANEIESDYCKKFNEYL